MQSILKLLNSRPTSKLSRRRLSTWTWLGPSHFLVELYHRRTKGRLWCDRHCELTNVWIARWYWSGCLCGYGCRYPRKKIKCWCMAMSKAKLPVANGNNDRQSASNVECSPNLQDIKRPTNLAILVSSARKTLVNKNCAFDLPLKFSMSFVKLYGPQIMVPVCQHNF